MSDWRNLTAGVMIAARDAFGETAVLVLQDDAGDPLPPYEGLPGIFFNPTEQVSAEGDDLGFDMSVPSIAFALADLPVLLMAPGGWEGATVTVRDETYEVVRKPISDGQAGIRLFLQEA